MNIFGGDFSGRRAALRAVFTFPLLFSVLCWLAAASGPAPAASYVFQLDTGGHQGDIKDVIFTADGNRIVSAGDDKVIRVWDWRKGRTIRTIRGEIAPGNSGKIFALALSPDERWLAAAGWMDDSDALEPCCGDIRIFDFATGKLVALLQGHDNSVYDLAFSPDNRLLASAGADQRVILWDVDTHKPVRELDEDAAHTDRVVKVQFADDGRKLVTASYDGTVKLWSTANGKLISQIQRHATRIYALAVTPDGSKIASGDANGQIRLWEATTQTSKVFAEQKVTIGALSFSSDGAQLIATCGYHCSENPGEHVWDVATGRLLRIYRGHDDSVRAVAVRGGLVVTAGGRNNEIHIWQLRNGRLEQRLRGNGATVYSVGISNDGRYLAWGNENPCPREPACPTVFGKLQFQMLLPDKRHALENPQALTSPPADFLRAATRSGHWSAQLAAGGRFDRKDAVLSIRQGKKERAAIERGAENGFGHTAYSFLNGGNVLVSGGEHGVLASYRSRDKRLLHDFTGHFSMITAIAPSRDSKLIVTGSLDQTIRLWNAETGELIVSMLFGLDGEWVIWTQQGYYDSSPAGDRMVGWQINQGREREARYVSARQMKEQLYSPEIIRRAISLASAERAIKQLRPKAPSLETLLAVNPPTFDVLAPLSGSTIDRKSAIVTLAVDSGPGSLTRVEVIVNNHNVTSTEHTRVDSGLEFSFPVPLASEENHILIIGHNDSGYTTERELDITNLSAGDLDKAGRLYLIAVGVDDYPLLPAICSGPGGSCKLNYSVADAVNFYQTVASKIAPRYQGASTLLLVNKAELTTGSITGNATPVKEPTASTITDQLKTFFASTEPEDLVIVFLAGHGLNIGESYFFAPTNAAVDASDNLDEHTLVSWKALKDSVQAARGTRLLFVDTCHSGNAYNASLEKDAGDSRIIAYSATKANSVSLELSNLNHGAFTYSLMGGLTGAADYNHNQTVEILELGSYVASEVKRLTRNQQSPVFYSSGVEDFPLSSP